MLTSRGTSATDSMIQPFVPSTRRMIGYGQSHGARTFRDWRQIMLLTKARLYQAVVSKATTRDGLADYHRRSMLGLLSLRSRLEDETRVPVHVGERCALFMSLIHRGQFDPDKVKDGQVRSWYGVPDRPIGVLMEVCDHILAHLEQCAEDGAQSPMAKQIAKQSIGILYAFSAQVASVRTDLLGQIKSSGVARPSRPRTTPRSGRQPGQSQRGLIPT